MLSVACAPPPKVIVEERAVLNARQEAEKIGGQLIRIVQPGDTLHAIAFVTNLDVNRVAAWNGISDTASLQVGQRIRLTEPIGFEYPTAKPKAESKPVVVLDTEPIVVTDLPSKDSLALPQSSTSRSQTPQNQTHQNQTPQGPSSQNPVAQNLALTWHWPVRGDITGRFSIAKGRQGIDIKAQYEQAVMAAGRGEVVYVGNSLKGYGNLVIIKHSDLYLSAYAHNDSIVVSEGQAVVARQKIGLVGAGKRGVGALHFQIRKSGKPVNPLNYLPKI